MLTPHTHVTPINITSEAEGPWHGREEEDDPTPQYSTPLQDALFIGGCIAFIAAMVAAIWAVVHYAPDTIHP